MDTDSITTYIARAATVVVAFVAVLREMRERRRRGDSDDQAPR